MYPELELHPTKFLSFVYIWSHAVPSHVARFPRRGVVCMFRSDIAQRKEANENRRNVDGGLYDTCNTYL